MNFNVKMTAGNREFLVSARQAATLQALADTNKGGFANVRGYKTENGQVANYTVLTRFNTARLYERRIKALEALELGDIIADIRDNPKVAALSVEELVKAFNARKADDIGRLQKSLDGVRETAQHEAHDRNYATITEGVKVHFVTEKNAEGIKVPVLQDGLPIVESIMLAIVEIKRDVLVEGEAKKPVNSGVPVILSNAMERHLPKSTFYRALSLRDNFESVAIGGYELVPEHMRGDYT